MSPVKQTLSQLRDGTSKRRDWTITTQLTVANNNIDVTINTEQNIHFWLSFVGQTGGHFLRAKN